MPAVVDITIVRPDLKYQLGFSVHEGMVHKHVIVWKQFSNVCFCTDLLSNTWFYW